MPDLKKHFNKEAEAFDEQVQKNIPCYNEMPIKILKYLIWDAGQET